ncbi:MAG: hypothetical protein JWM93_3598 [Frankiales bacterium]|nr:hypothetical protein [Frankiales bacterium]
MSATAGNAEGQRTICDKLGITAGMVVQEIGVDDDVDSGLRDAVAERTATEIVDADYDDVVDVVLLWWREDDGDLVDALVDSLTSLAASGVIWLLTPKAGRAGHVEPSDIGEAAPTAGLQSTSSISASSHWSGTRLVSPKVTRAPKR